MRTFRTRKVVEENKIKINFKSSYTMASPDDESIPSELHSPVLLMQASAAKPGNIPTVFVGIVEETIYTSDKWEQDKSQIARLFGITDMARWTREIKVSASLSTGMVDRTSLQQQVIAALEVINISNIKSLRIVRLGSGSSISVTKALESLIRKWNIAKSEKEVHFIGLGESDDYQDLNFCKRLCMKEECERLLYYNTNDFDKRGYFHQCCCHCSSSERSCK